VQQDPETTWLYLVRHGATAANEQVPYILQGNAMDLGLSPSGERQSRLVADFLNQFPIRHVYSSAMLRARQTAQAIAGSLAVDTTSIADLHECDVGVWEGLDWNSIREKYPAAHRKFVEDPGQNPYLRGESYGDVQRRTRPVIERLAESHRGESIAIVAHNVVNRSILADLLGIDLRAAPRIPQANCCVNLIRRRGGSPLELVTLNSVLHLHPLA
jgi:broad specificity phosphatase PhoE